MSAAEWSDGAAGPLLHDVVADLLLPDLDPDSGPLAWQDKALCAQVGFGEDLWFPEKGGSTIEAKRTCRSCEVRDECLEYALDNDERFGVWGGLSERERRHILRKRNREAVAA